VRPRSDRRRRFGFPIRATQHGTRHPRGVTAAIKAEVLRACVIAKSERSRRPFGWGRIRAQRNSAEATHAATSCTLGNRVSVLAGDGPNSFGSSPALHVAGIRRMSRWLMAWFADSS
jgi:hypothetical protein